MVAIGGIADIVQHWQEMARSRMTRHGHRVTRHGHRVSALRMIPESSKNSCSLWRTGNNSLRLVAFIMVATISEAGL
jgi:hypothetical protein